MGQTLTNADEALKEFYLPTIREQINQDIKAVQLFERNSTDIEGRRAILSVHLTRNSGVGARSEGADLPTAGNQGYGEERIPVFYQYGRLQVTGPVIKAMKSDKGSFTRAVESESKGLVNDVKRDENRQIWGTSDGVIATCGTTSASTTLTLAATTTATQMRQFHRGQRISTGTKAEFEAGTATDVTITSIDAAAKTMVISSAVTTDSSDFVSVWGTSGTTQREMTGIRTIVDSTGALHNLNPSTEIEWAAYEASNSGTNRAPTDDLFEQAADEIYLAGGEYPDLLFTSHGVRRAYANQLKAQKRFSNTVELKGGFSAVSVDLPDGKPLALVAERDCPDNSAFLINSAHMTFFEESDWEFMDDDGAVLSRVSNKDAYEATLYKYRELATDKRNAHGKILDLTNS